MREGMFWRAEGDCVRCELCYRHCLLREGAAGWCGTRRNDGGRMVVTNYGVVPQCELEMFGLGKSQTPLRLYKPGALALSLGSTGCNANCRFCMNEPMIRRSGMFPAAALEKVAFPWSGLRVTMTAEQVIQYAREKGCSQLLVGLNEPTVSYEFTYDVARLARANRLGVVLATNGLSTPAAVRELAPYVDLAVLGIKGSLDPDFYTRWMGAPGATEVVLQSAMAWRDSGVRVFVTDLLTWPTMQSAQAAARAQEKLYPWIAQVLGELTPIFTALPLNPWDVLAIGVPADCGGVTIQFPMMCLTGDDRAAYLREVVDRAQATYRAMEAAGIKYYFGHWYSCHNCGQELLRFLGPQESHNPCRMAAAFCPNRTHEQHVTGGRCDYCGAEVPIVTLTAAEVAAARKVVASYRNPMGQVWMRVQDKAPAWAPLPKQRNEK